MSINLVLLGIATTISPLFVLTAVVMMSSSMKVHNAWAAAAGWMVSIGVSAALVMIIGSAFLSGQHHHGTPWWMGALDMTFGVLLGVLAIREWRRYRSNPASAVPKWFDRAGTMSILFAFGVGLFLPANILAYAAGNEIAQQHYSGSERWIALGLYVVVGSLLEVLPILWFTILPSRRAARLPQWNAWLGGHWQEVVAVLFAVLSAYLLFKGVVAVLHST